MAGSRLLDWPPPAQPDSVRSAGLDLAALDSQAPWPDADKHVSHLCGTDGSQPSATKSAD
jgi:hypothetical protein